MGTSTHLRVAVVITSAAVGGTEAQAAILVRGLVGRGHEVHVFLLDGSGQAQDFGSAPVNVLAPPTLAGRLGAVGPFLAAVRLGRALNQERFDVVHAMMARAHVLAPLLASVSARKPLVVAWRRNTGAHSGFGLFDRLERWAASRTDIIVANSERVREYWQVERRHRPRIGYRVVPNALEAWRFDKGERAKTGLEGPIITTVGNLRPVKGHSDLIEAAATLRDSGCPVSVVIVGEGPLKTQLRDQARSMEVPLQVIEGVTDPRPFLRATDVYVHPSHQEGASNAVGEALAQACRVVSTDTGDARDLLGDTGRIVPPGRPDLLAAGLLDELRGASPGDNERGRRRAQLLREPVAMVEAHLDVYQEGVAHVRHRRRS